MRYSPSKSQVFARRSRRAAGAAVLLLACCNARFAGPPVYTLANPDDAIFGEDQTVETVYEDTLYDLARKFSLGSEELIRVNPGIDPWIPGAGKTITRPGRHMPPPVPH